MRNRGGYHKNNYHRGGGRGGYNNRGGKYNNYKRRRSSFERDDYQEDPVEPVFGESSGAPLGNFKIVLGGGESRVIAGENEDVPSIHSRLGATKLRTRIHSSEEEEQEESKVLSSRIVRPPVEKRSRSPSPLAKSNRVVTTTSSKSDEAKENGFSKIGANHSRSARIKSRSRERRKTRSKDEINKKHRSPTPKRRRSKSGSPKASKKSSSSPKRSSRRSPSIEKSSQKTSSRKISTDRREIKPAEPIPASTPIENTPDQNSKRPEVLTNPQLTQIDIEELVELNFDFFKKQLKKIVNHRDRLGRTPLMIILEYTAVKSNIKSFEESHFKHVTRATRELISAGADVRIKDIFGDTVMQYLARWRFGKENFKSKSEQHLPRRMREILKELPLKEAGRGALSIAELKDGEGKTFYHNLFWSNFRDQSQVEIDRLAGAFEIIMGSLKMNDEDWEIEDGEGNTLADTLLESELFSKAAYRAMKEKSGRVEIKPVERAPDRFGENPFKPKKNQSPRRKDEERSRKESPSPVRRKRSSEGEERPSSRRQQQSQVDYYSDSEHADEMDIHANADDFIDDVIQLIPQKKKRTNSRRSETPKRKRSRSSSKSKRGREDPSRRTRRDSDANRSSRKTRASPIPEEPVRRRHDSRSSKKNGDVERRQTYRSKSPSRDRSRRRKSPEMAQRNDSRGRRSPDRRRLSRQVSKSPERKRPMNNDDRRQKDRSSPMRSLDSRRHKRDPSPKSHEAQRSYNHRSRSNSPPRNFERASRHSPIIDDRRRHSPERRRSPERRSRRESKDQLLRLANY